MLFRDVDEVIKSSQGSKNVTSGDVTEQKMGRAEKAVVGKLHFKKKERVFKDVESEDKINNLSNKQFAEQSRRKIRWAVNLYCQWRLNRMNDSCCPSQISRANLDFVFAVQQEDLAYSLARFLREVKRVDGKDYPPNTLRELVIMIQMFLHEKGIFWRLLEQLVFQFMRNVLDNTMKERTALGLEVRQSSSIISLAHEDVLFQTGALGEQNPEQLLRTIIYMLGLHLALWGGVEHNRLRRPGFNCQIVVETFKGRERLVYSEDLLQKTNQGGLNARNGNKIVYVYPASDQYRCPVRLYKKYVGLLPLGTACGKMYMRPKQKFSPSVWFCDQPYGKANVCSTVKNVCKIAGIEGNFTNHSLRATSASRMYNKNIPEQVIKEVTGHRSDCVRIYKCTSDQLREEASNTIAGNVVQNDDGCKKVVGAKQSEIAEIVNKDQANRLAESLSVSQMLKNIIKTKIEMRRKLKVGSNRVKRLANKIVKKSNAKLAKKHGKKDSLVIDLNVNVKMNK